MKAGVSPASLEFRLGHSYPRFSQKGVLWSSVGIDPDIFYSSCDRKIEGSGWVLDTFVNMILYATISPDISKMNSANGSVRINTRENQTSLFQFKNDEYAGVGVL